MALPATPLLLIQAPMAGVQDSRLAIAVSRAGGLGSLPCAMLSTDTMRHEIQSLRSALDCGQPYNLNFFSHVPQPVSEAQLARWRTRLQPYYDELGAPANAPSVSRNPFDAETAELLEEFRPPVVSFHFGLPEPALLNKVKRMGSLVMSSATTVDEALWLARNGADAIIAQGLEAGGHRGHFLSDDLSLQMGTFALLPQVVHAMRPLGIPVVAAGGIGCPEAVTAALALGASAVQVGTAFLCAHEARTSAIHRAALHSEAARHTMVTTVFSGRPARGIVNRVLRELGPFPDEAPPFPHASAALAPLRAAAEAQGSGDFSPLWSGQNNMLCRTAPAADITRWLAGGLLPSS